MCDIKNGFIFCENYTMAIKHSEDSDDDEDNVLYPSVILTMLDENQRVIFFILYLIIFSLSMIGNIATLFTTYERKIRLIQKILIISLALSDIIVCVFIGVNNMINFSHPMINWVLGEFMCSFMPYIQIVGSVANSITMVSIACDRYINIIRPTSEQWNPNIWLSSILLIVIWGISAGVSYPMFTFTTLRPIFVLITDDDQNAISTEVLNYYLCLTSHKADVGVFYSIIFSIIFAPLMLAFLWFYYKIAKLIWKQRKPVGLKKASGNHSVTMETSTDSKTSGVKHSPIAIQVKRKMKTNIQNNRLHMERKIRTFKIILIIMLVFFICRIPYWIFSLIKYSTYLTDKSYWITANALSLLIIINTSLNPFLYSFLNQTIMYFDKFFISIGEFISNILCCCCTNTEFDDFEKDNPFSPENYNPRPSQTSSIIPKGPYMDYMNSNPNNVKFMNVPIVNLYPKENSSNCNTY